MLNLSAGAIFLNNLITHKNITRGCFLNSLIIYYALAEALGVKTEPQFGPEHAGDIKHSSADISKA
ncbi:MAG: hypothetical protein IJ667_05260, partial [Synergistaceae bacterium]|nr:hypothetical protein [Synergistaceae bacterium]